MNKRVTRLSVISLTVVLSGCSGLLPWNDDQTSQPIITDSPRLAATRSPSQDEPGSQLYLKHQQKEAPGKHDMTVEHKNMDRHINNTKGNHHAHTNQHNGREEVMNISSHNKEKPLFSRDNLNILILGSIAALLSITVVMQRITRGKGV
jgi:hypothetical protein